MVGWTPGRPDQGLLMENGSDPRQPRPHLIVCGLAYEDDGPGIVNGNFFRIPLTRREHSFNRTHRHSLLLPIPFDSNQVLAHHE